MRKYKIEIKWALIFIVASLIWMGIENVAGLHGKYIDKHIIYTNLFGLAAIVLYVLALLDKRRNFYNGRMTWKQGFISGMGITIIIACFSPLTQLIVHKIIAPSYFKNAIEYGVSMGRNLDTLEGYFNLRWYIFQSFSTTLSLGILASALVALVVRRQ